MNNKLSVFTRAQLSGLGMMDALLRMAPQPRAGKTDVGLMEPLIKPLASTVNNSNGGDGS